ncbi:hypothetical protein K7W42_13765 [Deinococcus sp. HMF7604]|uniref:hypothetical protein n=1 Tax=Deinococcus betulae TaxID=2873312 RepID=UPI001CCAF285|nr:hypothetical protein [Deinococcus betulae]MBZ9751922.1 hypothetical protein [Deinococcus betulae]
MVSAYPSNIRLHLYLQAVDANRMAHPSVAIHTLALAFKLTPPTQFAHEECQIILPLLDELVYLGQLLPDLNSTLDLLRMVSNRQQAA